MVVRDDLLTHLSTSLRERLSLWSAFSLPQICPCLPEPMPKKEDQMNLSLQERNQRRKDCRQRPLASVKRWAPISAWRQENSTKDANISDLVKTDTTDHMHAVKTIRKINSPPVHEIMDASTAKGSSEVEELGVTLPEELIEKILSRIPFPYIFKAKLLSRDWRWKFERVCRSACGQWPSYCPAFFDTRSRSFLGYDRARDKWLKQKLNTEHTYASLKCLQKPSGGLFWERLPTPCEVEGVLFCRVDIKGRTVVTNLLTGKSRTIPSPPNTDEFYWVDDFFSCFTSIIVPLEPEKYQLVVCGLRRRLSMIYYMRRIFNFSSMTRSSTTVESDVRGESVAACSTRHFAYLDGSMFYLCSDRTWARTSLVQVNFEQKYLQQVVVPYEALEDRCLETPRGVVRCGSRVIIFTLSIPLVRKTRVHLYEVICESGTLTSINLLSEKTLEFFVFSPRSIIADRSAIYFYASFYLAYYELESDKWNIVYHEIQLE
ncbi:hypothetical protein R1flu_020467 [Riccia fluitans]|uniref:F-box domain-containing protein n=1 Tax=Riccia fluitans TaxID=41844 RepID=A0ABD1ZQC3_9MARC